MATLEKVQILKGNSRKQEHREMKPAGLQDRAVQLELCRAELHLVLPLRAAVLLGLFGCCGSSCLV